METCPICERPLGDVRTSKHHLIPKCKKGKEVAMLHDICHAKIHHTFTETELEQHYHTAERLREHSEMQVFIKWVQKKDPSFYDRNKDTATRRSKRK